MKRIAFGAERFRGGPPDRTFGDRLRPRARALYLAARAVALFVPQMSRRCVPPPAPDSPLRLLALRTDRLGDMALTTAALQDLRDHFPRATIAVAAPPAPLQLLEAHPAVDSRHPLGGGRLPADLVGRFDLTIDFTSDESLHGALLAARSRSPYRIGLGGAGRQAFFNLEAPPARGDRHILDLNRDLLRSLGQTDPRGRPALYLRPDERAEAQSLYRSLGAGGPRVVVHPGAHYRSQRWSPERFALLIGLLTERTGAACLVLHGLGEEELVNRIRAVTPDAVPVASRTVRGMMALIASSNIFVGNNSGPLHIAGALGIPTVSVMGPTDPARFTPRGVNDHVLRRDIPCSPCKRAVCWHHTCLRSIDPEEVAEQAESVLASTMAAREAL